MVLKRYTLTVTGPDDFSSEEGSADRWDRMDEMALRVLAAACLEAEELIDDLLPDGYQCKITE
jgi:hypothetical protein